MLLAATQVAYAQKPVKVQGVIDGSKADMKLEIYLEQRMGAGNFADGCDTLVVKKGKFSYTKQIEGITKAWIGGGENQGVMPCNVYLVPGETMKLTLKGGEYFYGGSKIYQECNETDLAVTPLYQDFNNYYEKAIERIQALQQKQTPQEEIQAISQKMSDTLMTKRQAYADKTKAYFESHKNTEGAALYLIGHLGAEEIYNQLNNEMKQGRVGQYLKASMDYAAEQRAAQEKAAAEAQAKLDAMSGAPAKDFTLKDLNGKDLSLSSLRGKYVVLDFWGSWCGWCIKGIPDMKKYYEKYAGKFEILGIDCNDSDEAWRKAVKQYELPWLHVYNPRSSSVLSDYAIQGFPTKIVIDPQGNVAKIIVGEDPAFYEYLDQILSKVQ